MNDAPPGLAARIATTGSLLVCRDPEAEHAFRRDAQLRAADLEPFLRRAREITARDARSMTYLVERLAELKRYLAHAHALRLRVPDTAALERDLSLRHDVLFTLLTLAELVIDVAGALSSRRGDWFEDYTEAIKNLVRDSRFAPELVGKLERLPDFRNVVIHEYVVLDLERVIAALNEIEPIERFVEVVAGIEASD